MGKVMRGVWRKARGWPENQVNSGARCVYIYIGLYGWGYFSRVTLESTVLIYRLCNPNSL